MNETSAMVGLMFQTILLPVHMTLAWLFIRFTKARDPGGIRAVVPVAIVTAVLAWLSTAVWTHHTADLSAGAIWPYVLATAASFLVFSTVLAVVWALRGPVISRNIRQPDV